MSMDEREFELASGREISKRRKQLQEFLEVVLDPDERPSFVSDEATVYDIYAGDEEEILRRCREHYGAEMRDVLPLPVWKFLDVLTSRRRR
jgi:hypothetical protein